MNKKFYHDISYAHSATSGLGKSFIRILENTTGRFALRKRSQRWLPSLNSMQGFWHSIMEVYGVTIDVMQGDIRDIPSREPLIVVANHPYGILDGLVMGSILAQCRANLKILQMIFLIKHSMLKTLFFLFPLKMIVMQYY